MKKLILSLSIVLLLTGCSSISTNMEIKDDKSMNLSIDVLFEEDTRNMIKSAISSKKSELENRGFTIKEKASGFYGGYNVSKEYDNIDDLTYSGNDKVVLSDFINEDFNENKIFSVKKGLFYNTYTAYFEFESLSSLYEENKDKIVIEKETTEEKNTTDETNNENELVEDEISTELEEMDFSEEIEVSKYKFSVTLPDKPIISNAITKSNDGKTLSWTLSNTENTEVKFSFKMKNTLNTILFIVGCVLIFGIIIFILVKILIKKRKQNSNQPIYRGYDESIKDVIEKDIKPSNVGTIAGIAETPTIVEQPAQEEIKAEEPIKVVTESFVVDEPKPEIANVNSNIETLNSYEMKPNDEVIVKDAIVQNPQPKVPLFVNNFNQVKEPEVQTFEEKKKIEIDVPNIEELK